MGDDDDGYSIKPKTSSGCFVYIKICKYDRYKKLSTISVFLLPEKLIIITYSQNLMGSF